MSDQNYPPNKGQKDEPPESPVELTQEDRAAEAPEPDGDGGADAAAPEAASGVGDVAELHDRILRLAAELENTRRRAERQRTDAGRYAIAAFARDLLAVADNFDRALAAAGVTGDTIPEGHSDAFNALVSGIQMTEKELITILQRHGVEKVSPAGEKFDPHLHQAVAQIPSDKIPSGHIVDIVQPGFTIGERVLRAAMVTVSSGSVAPDDGAAPGAHVDTKA